MGCCTSRKETDIKVEENLIIPFETRLGFSKYSYKQLIKKLPTPSTSSYIHYSDLSSMFKSLSIPLLDFSEFYDHFERSNSKMQSSKKYSYLKLNSLFLLLCKDDSKTKLNIWIRLYENKNKSLSKIKVDEMLENFIKVSVEYICLFLAGRNKDNHELASYEKMIRTGKHFVLEELSRKLRANKPVVSIEEFSFNCLQVCGNKFFGSSFFRDKSYFAGIRYQNMRNNEKLEKAKKKIPLFIEDDRELEKLRSKPTMHSKNNSSDTLKNDVCLFQPESTRYLKENFRYGQSTSSSPQRLTLLKIPTSVSNKNILDKQLTSRQYVNTCSPERSPFQRTEVGIRTLFNITSAYSENKADETVESQVRVSFLDE